MRPLRALPLQQAAAREDHAHVADGVFQVVGFLALDFDRNVFQGFVGRGDAGRAPQHVVGDGIVLPRQAEGHCVEIVLGAVDGVGDQRAAAVQPAGYRLVQRLQQHDVVVHGIDPFLGVVGQVQDAGQFAVGQFHHDGQRALAVQRRTHRDQRGVGDFAVQRARPRHAQRGLHCQPVVLLHLVHGDGQRAHLVLAHVVEPEVQRQARAWEP